MSELSPEELALLAQAEQEPEAAKPDKAGRRRKADDLAAQAAPAPRGPFTPVQFEDDGWNGLPVQMRG